MSGVDYARVFFGENAVHVPAWMYVQNQGQGVVSFVGGSRTPAAAHPARYGSERTHQLIVGELLIRPHAIVATDALRGMGLASLVTNGHDVTEMLRNGEYLLGNDSHLTGWLDQPTV
jgi:hypothetical protein